MLAADTARLTDFIPEKWAQLGSPCATATIDHTQWQRFLDAYLAQRPGGVSRLASLVTAHDLVSGLAGKRDQPDPLPCPDRHRFVDRAGDRLVAVAD